MVSALDAVDVSTKEDALAPLFLGTKLCVIMEVLDGRFVVDTDGKDGRVEA